jgi:hypothetical protein
MHETICWKTKFIIIIIIIVVVVVIIIIIIIAKICYRMAKHRVLYSGHPEFKPRLRDRLFRQDYCGFPHSV